MHTYLCVYLGSTLLALLITPVVIWLARRIGAMDHPTARSVHQRPVPRIGGVAIFVSSMCLILSVLYLHNDIGATFRDVRLQVTVLLGSATFVFLVGLVDDLMHLPARFKFLAELAAAGALCLVGVRIDDIGIVDGYLDLSRLARLSADAALDRRDHQRGQPQRRPRRSGGGDLGDRLRRDRRPGHPQRQS